MKDDEGGQLEFDFIDVYTGYIIFYEYAKLPKGEFR
jgi:hypothetical protein